MHIKLLLLLLAISTLSGISHSQQINDDILKKQWNASWIVVPGESSDHYGVYLYRKKFTLKNKPGSFTIHVSADNRYKLYVNGNLVSMGPARGDISHWNYETVDLASNLKAGENVIAAIVWNHGEWRAEFQMTLRTGFIIQGSDSLSQIANTNSSWKCIKDSSFQPIRVSIPTYYVAGPGDYVTMARHIKNWESISYNDTAWKNARTLAKGAPRNMVGPFTLSEWWMLVPSSIPQMELKTERLNKLRLAKGVKPPFDFPAKKHSFIIPANTDATILLDQSYLTNAYTTIEFGRGNHATIAISYAEALFTKYPFKGNRDSIDNKVMIGRKDSILSDGSENQSYTTLTWRTYRYVQIHIHTQGEALQLNDFYGTFTGYPFQFNASFKSDQPELNRILEIGWRTARLDAMETYMDCPYYEQLQYIGDSRIQALVSLYNSGDDRLLKNALNLMDQSRMPEGLTESRHPSFTPQYIPTFSLWYIGMLHDYWMYGKDAQFVKDKLPGVRMILNYFKHFQQADGSLKDAPFWMFTDWVPGKRWPAGVGPIGADGTSSLQDLQLLWAYQLAADMENKLGLKEFADEYSNSANKLKQTILSNYWDNNRHLFADTKEKDIFSQHANTLAILTGIISAEVTSSIAKRLLTDTLLAPASIYFRYYVHQALTKAGYGNDYINWLDVWRDNIKMGMTTWAEISDINATRSDCHAWGASPNIELFRTVLGIDSDAPQFQKVRIEPHLGFLQSASGEIPHSSGKLSVQYQNIQGKWHIAIQLPGNVTGRFIWNGNQYDLKTGMNQFIF
jgi:Glycogen debranching enzyme